MTESDGLQFAWRVHAALDSWTAKVDTKASISLAIETAVLGFIISLSGSEGPLSHLRGTDLALYRVGLTLIGVAVLLVLAVVFPQLNRRGARRDWKNKMIYFGHLRHWDVGILTKALQEESPRYEQLAAQLVQMSKIAWRKHVWLQWSLSVLVLGGLCVAITGF